jgi:hypothetical protein
MAVLGCTGTAPGSNDWTQMRDGYSGTYDHEWECFVFCIPGVGLATLDYLAVSCPTSSYNWYSKAASIYARLVSVEEETGKPDYATTLLAERVLTGIAAQYQFANSTDYATKVTLPAPAPTLTRGTRYAWVSRGSNTSSGKRAQVTNEVPTLSQFNCFYANADAASPPSAAQWNEPLGYLSPKNNYYAELGYTLVPYLRLLSADKVSDQVVDLHFNGPVDQTTSEDETKYAITRYGGGEVPDFVATRQADTTVVRLTFASPLSGTYNIDAFGLLDLDGLAIVVAYDNLDVTYATGGAGRRRQGIVL